MEKYVVKNHSSNTDLQTTSVGKQNINIDIENDKAAGEKPAQLHNALPERLKAAIDNLGLSRIQKNKALKLVCIIIQKGMYDNHDLSDYISLSTKYFEKVFTKEYHTDFFNKLKSAGILECNGKYKQGSKFKPGQSMRYRINHDLLQGEYVPVFYTDRKSGYCKNDVIIINRTYAYKDHKQLTGSSSDTSGNNRNNNVNNYTNPSPMHISTRLFEKSLLIDDLSSLVYDEGKIWKKTEDSIANISTRLFKTGDEIQSNYFKVTNRFLDVSYEKTKKEALELAVHHGATLIQDGKHFYIDNLERYIKTKKENIVLNHKWQMAKLKDKLFYVKRSSKNWRLDHNLTCMSKLAMKAIKEDNDLIEIDIKNSQFAIHAFWMKQEGFCTLPSVQRYYEICSKGVLYEELGKTLNIGREAAKQLMMEIAFPSEEYNSPAKAQFKRIFPNVIAHIDGFKKMKKDSSLFSIELQQIEAEIFVDNLYPNIKELGIFCLTKHDSIIIKRCDEAKVVDLIRAYFNHLEFECVLDVEGKTVTIKSGNNKPASPGCVLDTQIQDETEIEIECQPEPESEVEQEEYERKFEATIFPDLDDKPDWWQGLSYFIENYGSDSAKEMYEGQTNFIGKM